MGGLNNMAAYSLTFMPKGGAPSLNLGGLLTALTNRRW